MFIECYYNKQLLNVHFDDSFSYESSSKKRPKWYEEMTTRDSG